MLNILTAAVSKTKPNIYAIAARTKAALNRHKHPKCD